MREEFYCLFVKKRFAPVYVEIFRRGTKHQRLFYIFFSRCFVVVFRVSAAPPWGFEEIKFSNNLKEMFDHHCPKQCRNAMCARSLFGNNWRLGSRFRLEFFSPARSKPNLKHRIKGNLSATDNWRFHKAFAAGPVQCRKLHFCAPLAEATERSPANGNEWLGRIYHYRSAKNAQSM